MANKSPIQHSARILWERAASEGFLDRRYSRAHRWFFDGGAEVAAAASPHNVMLPYTVAENVDPDEAFIAAISSCHMLTFLFCACRAGYVVDRYDDEAMGLIGEFVPGHPAVVKATLRPVVAFSGEQVPSDAELERLHHEAHSQCFIANSVKTEIVVEGRWTHDAR
ncbi:MAG: OsmC family peroxiredoxin [Rubrivivax sp.]|nr:MAG: OsmC family peroxiredoxin [Rubrivivax sp.]